MTEEGFFGGVVPAVSSSGHRLSDVSVFKQIDKSYAGIMAALIGMNNGVSMDTVFMVSEEVFNSLKDEILLQRFRQHISQDLFCESVLDRREISLVSFFSIEEIGDICQ